MMTRTAKLNHNYQLPLGIDCEDLEIVDLIKCSKFWYVEMIMKKLTFSMGNM